MGPAMPTVTVFKNLLDLRSVTLISRRVVQCPRCVFPGLEAGDDTTD